MRQRPCHHQASAGNIVCYIHWSYLVFVSCETAETRLKCSRSCASRITQTNSLSKTDQFTHEFVVLRPTYENTNISVNRSYVRWAKAMIQGRDAFLLVEAAGGSICTHIGVDIPGWSSPLQRYLYTAILQPRIQISVCVSSHPGYFQHSKSIGVHILHVVQLYNCSWNGCTIHVTIISKDANWRCLVQCFAMRACVPHSYKGTDQTPIQLVYLQPTPQTLCCMWHSSYSLKIMRYDQQTRSLVMHFLLGMRV